MTELKKELSARGLATSGLKKELQHRLALALHESYLKANPDARRVAPAPPRAPPRARAPVVPPPAASHHTRD